MVVSVKVCHPRGEEGVFVVFDESGGLDRRRRLRRSFGGFNAVRRRKQQHHQMPSSTKSTARPCRVRLAVLDVPNERFRPAPRPRSERRGGQLFEKVLFRVHKRRVEDSRGDLSRRDETRTTADTTWKVQVLCVRSSLFLSGVFVDERLEKHLVEANARKINSPAALFSLSLSLFDDYKYSDDFTTPRAFAYTYYVYIYSSCRLTFVGNRVTVQATIALTPNREQKTISISAEKLEFDGMPKEFNLDETVSLTMEGTLGEERTPFETPPAGGFDGSAARGDAEKEEKSMRGGGIKYKSTARGDVVMTLDASVNDFVALVPGLDDIVNAINDAVLANLRGAVEKNLIAEYERWRVQGDNNDTEEKDNDDDDFFEDVTTPPIAGGNGAPIGVVPTRVARF